MSTTYVAVLFYGIQVADTNTREQRVDPDNIRGIDLLMDDDSGGTISHPDPTQFWYCVTETKVYSNIVLDLVSHESKNRALLIERLKQAGVTINAHATPGWRMILTSY